MFTLTMQNMILAIISIAAIIYGADGIATMAIDIGSEFMKVAIVKPGVPMEIALNRESQRKTPVVVSMRNDERQIGDPALSMAVKFPQNAFIFIPTLIGQSLNSPAVKLFKERFPHYQLSEDSEGQLTFTTVDDKKITVEEIIAMLLESAQETAEKFADQSIKDAVITVPPYFSQAERLAVLRAADYAGLTVLQLMNSNAAVALNFGIFRSKSFNKTAQYYMFYDMGSSSTIATVVSYQVGRIREKGTAEEHPQVQVLGVGYDETLGASAFILRLRDHLAKEFNAMKLSKLDITGNARAMAKVFKEAGRVYRVLSANKEAYAQIESAFDDKDFKVKVTRDELEAICADLYERVTRPIESALNMAQIPLDLIKEVILMGGGTRSPKVQEAVLKATGKSELGKSINTDEAAALGAVYQAAHLSPGFRVKRFAVRDATLFPLAVDFKTAEDGKEVKRLLFNLGNLYPQRKVMTFNKHTQDFDFSLGYTSLNHLNEFQQKSLGNPLLYRYSLKGVAEAVGKHDGQPGAQSKGVKAHFRLDDSGIVHLDRTEAHIEVTPIVGTAAGEDEKEGSAFAKIGESLGSLFGSGGSEKKQAGDSTGGSGSGQQGKKDDDAATASDEANKSQSSDKSSGKADTTAGKAADSSATAGNATANKTEPPKVELKREQIQFVVADKTLVHPSDASQQKSRSTIQTLRQREEQKRQLEKARNELEAFIFESKDRLELPDYVQCSAEAERQGYVDKLREAQDWYEEQGQDTGKEAFTGKTAELKAMLADLVVRVREMQERPKAFKLLKDMLNHTRNFWDTMQNMTGEGNVFTQAEYTTLGNLINETEDWRKAREAEADKQDLTKEPLVRVEDLRLKMAAMEREISYLLGKIKYYVPPTPKPTQAPPPPPPPPSTSDDNKSTGADDGKKKPAEGEGEGEAPTPPADEKTAAPPPPPPPPTTPPPASSSSDDVEVEEESTTPDRGEGDDEGASKKQPSGDTDGDHGHQPGDEL